MDGKKLLAGKAEMVDISCKDISVREAVARGRVLMQEATLRALAEGRIPKGDVFNVARVAGLMAAKQTANLIPLCHPLPVESASVEFRINSNSTNPAVEVEVAVKTSAKTGVEMEALTGVSVALLTIYDMCKPLDKTMKITDIQLVKKTGGKSGDFIREGETWEL